MVIKLDFNYLYNKLLGVDQESPIQHLIIAENVARQGGLMVMRLADEPNGHGLIPGRVKR